MEDSRVCAGDTGSRAALRVGIADKSPLTFLSFAAVLSESEFVMTFFMEAIRVGFLDHIAETVLHYRRETEVIVVCGLCYHI